MAHCPIDNELRQVYLRDLLGLLTCVLRGVRVSTPSTALSKLQAAAAQFEAGTLPPGDDFRRLLEGSSRAGGARPRALVHDESGEWLAKFPSRARDDAYDVVGLEATCLTLARH